MNGRSCTDNKLKVPVFGFRVLCHYLTSRYFPRTFPGFQGSLLCNNQKAVPTSVAFFGWLSNKPSKSDSEGMFFLVSVSYVPVVLHVSDISKDFPGYQAPFLQNDQHQVPGQHSKDVIQLAD